MRAGAGACEAVWVHDSPLPLATCCRASTAGAGWLVGLAGKRWLQAWNRKRGLAGKGSRSRAGRASAPARSHRSRHSASNVHAGERAFPSAQGEPGRQALVCGTLYQLMGAVALLLQGATCPPETCDLYLRHGFANAAAISRRLRDEHLARTVVDVASG